MGCYKVPYIIVLLSASPFMSVSICFIYFSALMMGVCIYIYIYIYTHIYIKHILTFVYLLLEFDSLIII